MKITPEQIESLKKNKEAFGILSDELQEAANAIGKADGDWVYFSGLRDKWNKPIHDGTPFENCNTYRLRPDYEPESETVECEIYAMDDTRQFERVKGSGVWSNLSEVIDMPDFLGFKFEDERKSITAFPVMYIVEGHELPFYGVNSSDFDKTTVLYATHVLFRRSK